LYENNIWFVWQETFDAGLQAFEKEGIQTITALKDQLVAANHAQTPAIDKRYLLYAWRPQYASIVTKWTKDCNDSIPAHDIIVTFVYGRGLGVVGCYKLVLQCSDGIEWSNGFNASCFLNKPFTIRRKERCLSSK
jgi:hypothetical protein